MHSNTLLLDETTRLDREALAGTYEQHSPGLYRYAYRLLGQQDLAEECVAETFSRLLQVLQAGGGPRHNMGGYLYRVAHNWITDYYRRQPAPTVPLDSGVAGEQDQNPSRAVARRLDQEQVRKALLQLTPEQRTVVVLRFLEDWPYEQIAASLGKSYEATRALQSRGLARLRRLLAE